MRTLTPEQRAAYLHPNTLAWWVKGMTQAEWQSVRMLTIKSMLEVMRDSESYGLREEAYNVVRDLLEMEQKPDPTLKTN